MSDSDSQEEEYLESRKTKVGANRDQRRKEIEDLLNEQSDSSSDGLHHDKSKFNETSSENEEDDEQKRKMI